jgi:flagellar biogenesis protein FliO
MEFVNQYMSVIIAGAVVLVLLVAALMLMKHFARRTRGRQGSRLGISEYHVVDEQRRLVLVRRDGVEHLLLIGGGQDVVVEASIRSRTSIASSDDEDDAPARPERIEPSAPPPIPLRPAPRAPVFADRRPQLRPVDPPIGGPQRNYEQDT